MQKSNCILFALPRWLRRVAPGEETYLVIRRSRVNWGLCHVLIGRLDPSTNQIAVQSYKPPPGHQKTGFAPVFHGAVVQGDADTRAAELDLD